MVIDQCLLCRMQRSVGRCDALDRPHDLALKLRDKEDAGIQCLGAGIVGDHDGAGAAIAFVAAFLRAPEPALIAQPIQQRHGW